MELSSWMAPSHDGDCSIDYGLYTLIIRLNNGDACQLFRPRIAKLGDASMGETHSELAVKLFIEVHFLQASHLSLRPRCCI